MSDQTESQAPEEIPAPEPQPENQDVNTEAQGEPQPEETAEEQQDADEVITQPEPHPEDQPTHDFHQVPNGSVEVVSHKAGVEVWDTTNNGVNTIMSGDEVVFINEGGKLTPYLATEAKARFVPIKSTKNVTEKFKTHTEIELSNGVTMQIKDGRTSVKPQEEA